MAVHYDFYKSPPASDKEGKVRLHPRVVPFNTVTPKDLAEQVQELSTASTADVSVVLEALRKVMIREIKYGNRVHLDGFGYFMMTLECEPIDDERKIRAESIQFKSISFKPEANLKKEFKTISLERTQSKRHSLIITDDAIMEKLAAYFATNRFISRQEFQALCGLRQTAAIQRLKHLTAMGLLNKVGSPHFPMYEPVNKEA